MKINEVYTRITEQIKQKLEQGTLPWKKSWVIGLPQNLISKRPYNGINFLSLCTANYPSPYYLTFLQCKEKGGYVKRDEKGQLIIFWKLMDKDMPGDEETESARIPLTRYSYVYNITQTSLYDDKPEPTSIVGCEEIINNIKDRPVIKHNTIRCYYSPVEDFISLPMPEDFNSTEEYYSTLFHELIHWTGHKSRLARIEYGRDVTEKATEELIAEIGSSYLCGLCGISSAVIDNQASYIDGWLSHLKHDPAYFIKAATAASKAVNFIMNNI